MPSRLQSVQTPCLLLDLDRMERNIARVNARAAALGVRLRPHFKTPKSVPILQRMMPADAAGVTVSTVAEAEYLAAAGYRDLLLTTPMAPSRMARVAALQQAGAIMRGVVDCPESILALGEAARALGLRLPVLVEINVDDFRGGLTLDTERFGQALDAFRRTHSIEPCGVLVYPGNSSRTRRAEERAALAERHCVAARHAADVLREHGFESPIRSFGSTSVLMAADNLDGITEHRGGVYVFQDLYQVGVGWCTPDDIALTVAATVVSHDPGRNRLFIDAGGLALSKDRSTAGKEFDARYGRVVEPETGEPIGDLWVEDVFQEHGVVSSAGGAPLPYGRLPIGRVVAIQTNHNDMTAAAYESYHVVRGGEVVDVWKRMNGW